MNILYCVELQGDSDLAIQSKAMVTNIIKDFIKHGKEHYEHIVPDYTVPGSINDVEIVLENKTFRIIAYTEDNRIFVGAAKGNALVVFNRDTLLKQVPDLLIKYTAILHYMTQITLI